jgi:hypothetical protein
MLNTLDFISTDDLPGTHIFLQNINNVESLSPRCTGYLAVSPNSLSATNSSSTKQYSNSNIAILERFQLKVLCLIVNAPWYVSNSVICKDLQIPSVKEEISRFSSHYAPRLRTHTNELIATLTEPPTHKHLCRYWPNDLLTRF